MGFNLLDYNDKVRVAKFQNHEAVLQAFFLETDLLARKK